MFGYVKAIAYRYGFFPSQLSKYKNIKISFLEQILILCENSCNKNSSKIISILDGTNAISKLKIFPQTNYICRILTNKIFFTESYNFHSVQTQPLSSVSHWGSAYKLGPDLS